jgi:hypothetical protein
MKNKTENKAEIGRPDFVIGLPYSPGPPRRGRNPRGEPVPRSGRAAPMRWRMRWNELANTLERADEE